MPTIPVSELTLCGHRCYPRAFFSCTYKLPILQALCFDIHPCNGGVYPPAWFCPLLSRSLRRYSLFPIPYPLSFQTLAHSFALFCAQTEFKSLLFMPFRTLCQKHPGGGWAYIAVPMLRSLFSLPTYFLTSLLPP